MPVLPALRPLFEAITANLRSRPEDMPIGERRSLAHHGMQRFVTGFYAPVPPLPIEKDFSLPVPGGSITVRIYSPGKPDEPLPGHVYFHGGGFWLGTLDHFDPLCRALARDAECVVAAVDYRLAPEHKFPTPLEDCYAACAWVRDQSGELGIDPRRISIGGVSAGGTLAAAVSMIARDRGDPLPIQQVLEVPITDLSDWSPAVFADEGLTLPSGKDEYCTHYLAEPAQASDPRVSPLLADSLAGMPPTLVMCAEYDPLAREGKAYAERLQEAGVPVEHRCWPGQFHGAQAMAALIPEEAADYHNVIVNTLRRAFGTVGG